MNVNQQVWYKFVSWRKMTSRVGQYVFLISSLITPGNPFSYLERKRLPCGKYNVYIAMFM